jgi:hypothetical protein
MPPSNQFIKIIMLTETCISKIYVSGSNTLGQTGHPLSEKQFFSPQPCHFGVPILQVACGYYHTLLLLEGGWVYQAGDKQPYPYAVNAKEIINVAAGGYLTLTNLGGTAWPSRRTETLWFGAKMMMGSWG